MDLKDKENFIEAFDAVAITQETLATAKNEEIAARCRATDALNNANLAQKRFDSLLEDLRKNAELDTDWKRSQK